VNAVAVAKQGSIVADVEQSIQLVRQIQVLQTLVTLQANQTKLAHEIHVLTQRSCHNGVILVVLMIRPKNEFVVSGNTAKK